MNYEEYKKIKNSTICPKCGSNCYESAIRIIDFAPILKCGHCGYEEPDLKEEAWLGYIGENDLWR